MKAAVTTLVFCVAALLALGLVMLYSSGMSKAGAHFLLMQMAWGGCGLVTCVTLASLDYRILRKIVWPLFGLSLILLGLVLIPGLGIWMKGARRWLGYGPVRFQCSELAKIALVLALAWYGERYQRQMNTWIKGIVFPGLIILAVLSLIFPEPDRGCTILLGAVGMAILLLAGVRWYAMAPPALLAIAGLAYSFWHDPVRSKRIFSWLDLEESKSGVGYQAYQAMLALGAGGWTGLGLGNGRQKFGFVPEHHTDFILSMIGEELGLVATLSVVLAFLMILICGLYIAFRAPDTFGLLLASGLTFLISFQALINIGVVTSALPNKGLPLPFISYGGSNLVVMLTSVGILLSVARQARPVETAVKVARDTERPGDGNPFRSAPRQAGMAGAKA